MFQSTPRFVGEGNDADTFLSSGRDRFNPPPALSARGTSCRWPMLNPSRRFNPPPALSARGTSASVRTYSRVLFQSTPRFVGEGNDVGTDGRRARGRFNPPPAFSAWGTSSNHRLDGTGGVSIHPPLCRRGERVLGAALKHAGKVSIHPPLCRRGERATYLFPYTKPEVSIHPPLCRRGEPGGTAQPVLRSKFQSTPRFVGEGNFYHLSRRTPGRRFNPPPALSARGTGSRGRFLGPRRVSIHPPLCRRGEQPGDGAAGPVTVFQSTPRFVGEGNSPLLPGTLARTSFNPPPALSARGTQPRQLGDACRHVSIHPPLCRRGEHLDAMIDERIKMFQSTPRFVGEGNSWTTSI